MEASYRFLVRPGKDSHKTPVFGMAERKGWVVAKAVPNVGQATILPHVKKKVLPQTMIYTDDYAVYFPLRHYGYDHKRVHHK